MAERTHPFSRQSISANHEQPPPISVRFFYESLLAIDDPLSAVPSPQGSSTKPTPRPFSSYDNRALEGAWHSLREQILKLKEDKFSEKTQRDSQDWSNRKGSFNQDLSDYPFDKASEYWPRKRGGSSSREGTSQSPQNKIQLRGSTGTSTSDRTVRPSSAHGQLAVPSSTLHNEAIERDSPTDGLTRTPFARVPSRQKHPVAAAVTKSRINRGEQLDEALGIDNANQCTSPRRDSESPVTTNVPVGVSRLHQVTIPELRMEPIYWSPVNDIAAVARGTWFYVHTMLPVEADIANMLEVGYLKMKPWTQTWRDELDSAAEVGATGEEKILHKLWPEVPVTSVPSRPSSSMGYGSIPIQEDIEKLRIETVSHVGDVIDSMTLGSSDFKAAGQIASWGTPGRRKYVDSGIIYADDKRAYILRPNLQPSAYYGRRPLANYIRKGHSLGICVIRGFDEGIWTQLNPTKKGPTVTAAQEGVSSSAGGRPLNARMRSDPSLAKSQRPRVTDLILSVHGIGQKMSERVESFHFTHAMNAFRRDINVELGTPQVKSVLRAEMGGIMVLPVNWRTGLKFEEGGYKEETDSQTANEYTLKDITPDALSSVRQIIGEVLSDVPYYLSHHKETMIAAVIREANRIHKLWCSNNPGFEKYGRVHLIAHSLGSVMAIDILSRQPTTVLSKDIDEENEAFVKHLRFDTKNLYLAGSPAGFFLLLKSTSLLPRRGRNKSGTNAEDMAPGIVGEADTYGCLAVDNIYNIIHPYDPVSYRMNACVDTAYAASLKQCFIPNVSSSWFSRSNPLKATATVTERTKPGPQRLPSSVELEIHNFTREEIAETRFYLLNTNGQLDFYLRQGGGTFSIQYLTMLGAHSSYWLLKDFTRFIVLETGRKLGKEGSLEPLKAVKKSAR